MVKLENNRIVENKIPKIIHYCWFGHNSKSKLVIRCISSWKEKCPDYEFVEWNEENFDVNCCKYVKEAYEAEKWAFVTDYARLWILYNYGGIYLDTDVELKKNLDCLLSHRAFFASEDNKNINTGIGFGSVKRANELKILMNDYDDISFYNQDEKAYDETPCTTRNTVSFENNISKVSELLDNEKNGIIIYSKEYFCPFDNITGELCLTKNTYGIHWFNASWRSNRINVREKILRPLKRILKRVKKC